jgi:SPX domain protein involved in polyphosphate accumulation
MNDQRITKLEAELAAMREKVSFFSVIYEKFDKALEKMEQSHNAELKEVYRKIETTESKITEEIQALRADMVRHHEIEKRKIDELNKWRWLAMGGVAVITWLLSRIFPFGGN